MSGQKNRTIFLIIICFIILLSSSRTSGAEKVSFKQALEWGEKHNFELQELEDNITEIKRQIALIEAGQSLQLDFKANPLWGSGTAYEKMIYEKTEEYQQNGAMLELGLSGERSYLSGLSINSELSLTETDPINFNNIEDKWHYRLNINKKIFPDVPLEVEQDLYNYENDLAAARSNLEWERSQKGIDWIEGYLDLLRLKEKKKLAELNLNISRDILDQTLKKQSIGEASREQVLIERINLKQAKVKAGEAGNNYLQQKKSWYHELNLDSEMEVDLTDEVEYLQILRDRVKVQNINFNNTSELIEIIEQNNPQLKANRLKQELVRKRLKWQEDKGKVELAANTSYDYRQNADNWEIGFTLTYNFLDGGQQEIARDSIREELNVVKRKYQQLVKELKLELEALSSELQIAEWELEASELILEKASLKRQLSSGQLEQGLITDTSYQQARIEEEQALVDYEAARDKVFITRLRLIRFIGIK